MFRISGDSNVRAWQAEITKAEGTLIFNSTASGALHEIESLSLSIPAESILSDSNVLNGTMHNSLRSEEYPQILFSLTEVHSAEPDGDAFLIEAAGFVHAAGARYPVTMSVRAYLSESEIRFRGSQILLMSYFNIDPPTAMMGMFRADDEVEILFDLLFTATQP